MNGRRPLAVKYLQSVEECERYYHRLGAFVRNEYRSVKQVPNTVQCEAFFQAPIVAAAVGYTLLGSGINGSNEPSAERWGVEMYITRIPCVYVCLEESVPHRRVEASSTQAFVLRLLETDLGDFALIDRRTQFVGHIWSFYLSSKIGSKNALIRQAMDLPASDWKSPSLAMQLIQGLREVLEEKGNCRNLQTVKADNRSRRAFLSACDTRILTKWGKDKFAGYIDALGISLDDWLSIV